MSKAEPLIKEVLLNAPASKVWKAITDKNDMKLWYFEIDEFNPEIGFEFRFWGDDGKKKWLHLCKITEVIKEQKLTYSWKYDGYAGNSFVTFELFPLGDKTKLKLTHAGVESFQSDVNLEFKRENFNAGWTELIERSIKEFVERA